MRSFLSVSILLSAAFAAPMAHGSAAAAAPEPQERKFTGAEFQSDLDTMYRTLQTAAFDLNAFTTKSEMDRVYGALRAGCPEPSDSPDRSGGRRCGFDEPLSRSAMQVRLQLLAAAAHLGHARVDGPYADWAAYRKAGGTAFPLRIRVVGERMYVAQNLSGLDSIRPGDELTMINGVAAGAWLARTRRHISAETPYMANSILEYDFSIYLWVDAGHIDAFKVSIRDAAGHARTADVPARTADDMEAARATQPPVLDLEHPLRDARVLANGVAYLRPGPFYNEEAKTGAEAWDVSGFRAFIDGAFAQFEARHARRLIIDLRGNPGGDSLFSDVLISWFATRPFRFFSMFEVKVSTAAIEANEARIEHDAAAAGPISQRYRALYAHARPGEVVSFDAPYGQPRPGARFDGQVYVLIDRQSYSNCVAVAATVQDYKFGTILGEPTSDMATTYGAMETFKLPVSGISVGFPKARIVRPNGDLHSRGVTPDIKIRIPLVQSPSDAVLQQAAAIAAAGR